MASSSCAILVPLSIPATEESFHFHSSACVMRTSGLSSSCHVFSKFSAKTQRWTERSYNLQFSGKTRAFAMDVAEEAQIPVRKTTFGALSSLPSSYAVGSARAFAMDIAEETMDFSEERLIPGLKRRSSSWSTSPSPSPSPSPTSSSSSSSVSDYDDHQLQVSEGKLLLPRPPKNNADDPSLHNPLLRLHRMGCGWLGVIVEWDGVIVEDDSKLERESWIALAQEEGRSSPLAFILRKTEGMKSEQAISEVLCWSRDPIEVRRLALRKEELFQGLRGCVNYQPKLGSVEFLQTLKKYEVPVALVSARPRKLLEEAIESLSLHDLFSVVVSSEDVYRGKPDPEMYMYAAQLLGFIPERCIVIGNSNSSVEGAHDTFMKCIAVSGKHPSYELGAADLVITRLDDLSFVDLKNLADLDSPEFRPPEPQIEVEFEEEPLPRSQIALEDRW